MIENVRVETQPGELTSSPLSMTVIQSQQRWTLDVSSAGQLTPGRADAYATVTVTKTDGHTTTPRAKTT